VCNKLNVEGIFRDFWVVTPYSLGMPEPGKFCGHGAGDITASQLEDHDLKTNFSIEEIFVSFFWT
jgi:hypothetical protein